jgi:multiple sugar transport system permease protein
MTKLDYKTSAKLKAQRASIFTNKVFVYVFLIIIAIFILVPFYWMLNISFQSVEELNNLEVNLFPRIFSPGNYAFAIQSTPSNPASPTYGMNFWSYLGNTLIVAVLSTTLGIFFAIVTAFALARLNFKGREFIFIALLATMMIPSEMMVLTNFVTVVNLGWFQSYGIGSILSMTVPFIISIFHVFLLRQTFRQIPNELYYAAKVDGCKDFKYLWTVMVPMAKSAVVTITILRIMGAWNAFIWPNLVAHPRMLLVTHWLRTSFVNEEMLVPPINYQMAATVIVTLPLFILFVIFRKYIMTGVSRAGVKG